MTALKGFKVTDAERKLRIGIAAGNLDDLKKKTIQKFKLNLKPSDIWYQVSDGTLVEGEDYFRTLPAQTLLVWQQKGKYAQTGLETRSKTKEEYMYRRSQERIRTYYYRTREELTKGFGTEEEGTAPRLHQLLNALRTRLQEVDYYGCYFDRRRCTIKETHASMKCLCDPTGVFICGGRWDRERCLYEPPHSINPYESREARIIFQTWNLDHRVERSRTVIPEITKALRHHQKKGDNLNVEDKENFYQQSFKHLFTTENLKLVHIVCHDKARHLSAKMDPLL